MVAATELALLVVVLVLLVGAFRLVKAVAPLVINAVVGLVVLLVANALGFGVVLTPVVVLIVAFGGIPGAVLVILLARIGWLFEPVLVLPVLV